MDYAVEEEPGGKQKVVKLGLAPVQRPELEYEFQVVLNLDTDHRIDVGKTRAQPLAGMSWPAGQQERMAVLFRDWLASGVQLARQADVDALREVLRTADLGPQWQGAGWPKADRLNADQLGEAWAWVALQLGISPHPFEPEAEGGAACAACGVSYRARWHVENIAPDKPDDDNDGGTSTPDEASDEPEPEPARDAAHEPEDAEPEETEDADAPA
jgi:hypothetical protein